MLIGDMLFRFGRRPTRLARPGPPRQERYTEQPLADDVPNMGAGAASVNVKYILFRGGPSRKGGPARADALGRRIQSRKHSNIYLILWAETRREFCKFKNNISVLKPPMGSKRPLEKH